MLFRYRGNKVSPFNNSYLFVPRERTAINEEKHSQGIKSCWDLIQNSARINKWLQKETKPAT